MSTTWSEDSPNHKIPTEVDATPVEGLDREPAADYPAAAKPSKKATADSKVVEPGQAETKVVAKKSASTKKK